MKRRTDKLSRRFIAFRALYAMYNAELVLRLNRRVGADFHLPLQNESGYPLRGLSFFSERMDA